ncbi:MAG TPA: cytochrome c oxidase assembly protein [Methylomirabilota bacterium]|nr:cytochrome c oxidase assembly protein [Methylomirabilota bacterium]
MAWRWRPEVTLPLTVALFVYALGWTRLALRSPARRRPALVARLALSLAGLVLAAVALLGLHDAAHERFAAHMAQHLLLMMVAVPLLLLADPLPAALWALPAPLRRGLGVLLAEGALLRRGWRAVTRLPVAWILYALVLWLWHLPAAYDAALARGWLHDLEHLSFTAAAVVFWWPVIAPAPRVAAPAAPVARVVYLVLAALSGGALGVLLAASPAPLYAYATGDPLADQAWGGVLMWAVGGAIDMAAVLAVVARVLGGARRAPVP